jgi:hypothetical protein
VKTLRKLTLGDHSSTGRRRIAYLVKANTGIRKLTVTSSFSRDRNSFSTEDAEIFAKSLQQNNTITSLTIGGKGTIFLSFFIY